MSSLTKAIELLNTGAVVAIPTETVYGLAANAFNEKAVKAIYSIKKRPTNNPLILHFKDLDAALPYIQDIPEILKDLYQSFCPGPLTFLVEKSDKVPSFVTAGSKKVAVRFPNHPLTQELLSKIDFPLAAPSANPSGYISPSSAEHVKLMLGSKVPLILDGGNCNGGIESTIIGIDDGGEVLVYRQGLVTLSDLESVLHYRPKLINKNPKKIEAPGMLSSHYAPKTSTYIGEDVDSMLGKFKNQKIGLITLMNQRINSEIDIHIPLSKDGNLKEIAQNLYSVMHQVDQSGVEVILIEKPSSDGLGAAINDRLSRAGKLI